MRLALLTFMFGAAVSESGVFKLPDQMLGLWTNGIPEFTILGPAIGNLSFGVSQAPNGDYLFQDIIPVDNAVK